MNIDKPLIIGLHGPQRAGKNEVTAAICEHMTRNPEDNAFIFTLALSFSSPFKDIVNNIVGYQFTDAEKDVPTDLLGGRTPRDAQVYLGTMDQHFGGQLWARHAWEVRGDKNSFSAFNAIVYESVGRQGQWDFYMDLRDKGEIEARLVEVIRPGFVYKDNRQPIVDRDPSKTAFIVNSGGIYDLNEKVKRILVPWLLT